MPNNANDRNAEHQRHLTDEIAIARQSFIELERCAKITNGKLLHLLAGQTKEDKIERIKQLRLSESGLNLLTRGIILGANDSEIGRAAGELKNNSPSSFDETDHLNYLDL